MSWTIDQSHSQVEFSVRHMMISNVRGRFEEVEGVVEFTEGDLSSLSVDVSLVAGSIRTRDEKRDAHLRSADFLDAEQHPTLRFRSTAVTVLNASTADLAGELTIRGVTRPVSLRVDYAGVVRSPWGTESAGFSAHTRIDRKEWGLEWNQVLEAGGLLVGDEVKIDIELELVKQPAEVGAEA